MEQQPGGSSETNESIHNENINDAASCDLRELSPTEKRMASEHIPSLVIKYSIPTIISMFTTSIYNTVDRFWVGKIEGVGANALAGIGICQPLMNVILAFCMLIGIGAASRISISLGERNVPKAERILGNAFVLILMVAAVITVTGSFFKVPLLRLVGATDGIIPYALDYFTIIILGSVFSFVSFAMNHPIRALGNAKRFAMTQVVGAVVNIILDPVFIFVFDMGVKGVAYATIIAQFVSCVLVFGYYLSKSSRLKIRLSNLRLNPQITFAIVSIGVAPFVIQIAGSAIMAFSNTKLVEYGLKELANGDIAVSAMTVIQSLYNVAFTPIIGMNQGVQPIIGFNYGARDYVRVRDALKWAVVYNCIIAFVLCLIFEIFAPQMIMLFNSDANLITVGTPGLRIFFITAPLVGVLLPLINFFTAIGQAKMSIFLSMLRQIVILLPMYQILPLIFGLRGVFMAVPVSDFLAIIIIPYFVFREFKVLKTTFNRDVSYDRQVVLAQD